MRKIISDSGTALVDPPTFTVLTLANNWTLVLGSGFKVSKNQFNRVHFDGCRIDGRNATSSTFTTLPPSMWPKGQRHFPTVYWNGSNWLAGRVAINTDGTIGFVNNADAFTKPFDVLIDHISFSTDALS